MYTYGYQYPWWTNDIPLADKFEGMLQGIRSSDPNQDWGRKPFYTYFSSPEGAPGVSAGGKPFIVAETGAAYHYAWVNQTWTTLEKYGATPNQKITRVQMKTAWFESFLNPSFLQKYPKVKAVCTFEFVKSEEDTWRDFTNFGAAPLSEGFTAAANEVAVAFKEFASQSAASFLVFANSNSTLNSTLNTAVATTSKSGASVLTIEVLVNSRLGYKPLAFFQTDVDFSGTIKPLSAPNLTDEFILQLTDTNTDADAYLTVYPFQGLHNIT
ncbi:UNVERIFIED_CONTAM: hypothetical protein HDU68_006776, partial [Siphonaria sp. JEL0065]